MVTASRANPNASPSVPGTELRTSRHCGTALHPPSRRGTPSRGTSSSQTTIPRWRLTTTMVRKQRSVLELATLPALPRSHVSAQRQHRSQDRATISTKAISSSTARRDSRLTWARTTCALSATITRTWMKPVSREILRRSGRIHCTISAIISLAGAGWPSTGGEFVNNSVILGGGTHSVLQGAGYMSDCGLIGRPGLGNISGACPAQASVHPSRFDREAWCCEQAILCIRKQWP